jgi:hypothetical protein
MRDPHRRRPLDALNRILGSVEAVRNARAMFVLLATFGIAGLLLAMASASLVRDATTWGALQGGAAFTAAFYGSNTAGLLLMDEARGRPLREVADALRDALGTAHRLLLVLLVVAMLLALLVGAVSVALLAARLPYVGPALFGLAVPFGVLVLGGAMLAMATVVAPLAAPSIWSGRSVRDTLALLWRNVRQRLVFVALLMAAVSALTAVVAALVAFVVAGGGRAVAVLSILVTGVDLPPQQLMAGLFGYGLRSLGAVGAEASKSPLGAWALIGGGVVFAVALVLPVLVYLRGVCSVYLALEGDER